MRFAIALIVAACVTYVHGQTPVIVFAVDGLSPRACTNSPAFAPILQESAYTLRARTVEHTRSYEAWQAILMGGYDVGVNDGSRRPPLFEYIKSQDPSKNLWVSANYFRVVLSVGRNYADRVLAAYPASETVRVFMANVDAYGAPDLAVLYFEDCDVAGHRFGWDSPEYALAVEYVAGQIVSVRNGIPNITSFIVTDHSGRGGGHSYAGRNMLMRDTDIDATVYRDVPWIRYPDPNPRPLCDAVRVDHTAAEIARAMDITPYPSWNTLSGWFPPSTNCTYVDVSARAMSGAPQFTCNVAVLFFMVCATYIFG